MIFLDDVTKQLEVYLAASVASLPLPVTVNYEHINSVSPVKASVEGEISGTTPQVLLSLASLNINAGITYVGIVNADSAKALLTVQVRKVNIGQIPPQADVITPLIKKWVLSPLDVCFYSDNKWFITDKYGKMKNCCEDVHKPIRFTASGGIYANDDLIGLTAEFDFDIYSAEGSGVLLNLNDGYLFNSGTGTLTLPDQKYKIEFY
jgi:hypothetical protein